MLIPILLAAPFAGILALSVYLQVWRVAYKRYLFASARVRAIRSKLSHRIESIKQDPNWIERIEDEGPSALYNELARIINEYSNTSVKEDHIIVWDLVEKSGLINQRYLK